MGRGYCPAPSSSAVRVNSPRESVRTQETEAERVYLRQPLVTTGDVSYCPLRPCDPVGVEDHGDEDDGAIVGLLGDEVLRPAEVWLGPEIA